MAKIGKRSRRLAVSLEQVHRMGGKRARFILTVLLAADRVSVKAFKRASRQADHPLPIEQDHTGQGFSPRKTLDE